MGQWTGVRSCAALSRSSRREGLVLLSGSPAGRATASSPVGLSIGHVAYDSPAA